MLTQEDRAVVERAAQRLDEAGRVLEAFARAYGRDADRKQDEKDLMALARGYVESQGELRTLLEKFCKNLP